MIGVECLRSKVRRIVRVQKSLAVAVRYCVATVVEAGLQDDLVPARLL